MTSEDLLFDDDDSFDDLDSEAFADDGLDEPLRFTHAFVDATLPEVSKAIQRGLESKLNFQCKIYGAGSSPVQFRVFAAVRNGGTILWVRQVSLQLMPLIAHELKKTVHWISVYELFTCRAYVGFDNGHCTNELLDPVQYWTENILVGDDLVGLGHRKFDSYFSFKESISDWYIPKDEHYDFEKIDEDVKANTRIEKIASMVQFNIEHGEVTADFLGTWPMRERREIEESITEN